MKKDHPIVNAQWIWPEGYMYLYNHFAQFRRDFDLSSVPRSATLHLTADKNYKLYVNGKYVCRGPARGYQSHWPFDSIDLKPYLQKGHNWISVEAYNPGISTFQYLHRTRAGFLCAPEGKELCEAWKDGKWEYRRSPAHARETARLSLQIDFQEHVDFSKDDRSWIHSPRHPKDWHANIFRDSVGYHLNQPFGQPPYESVEERGLPMMREWISAPKRVIRTATGKSNDGYKTLKNISWVWSREFKKIAQFEEAKAIKSKRTAEAMELEIKPTGHGKYQAVFIDVGDFSAANLIVAIKGAKGGEILDFQYDQANADRNAKALDPGQGCYSAMSSRLRLAKGENEHEFFHLMGFQHLTVIARDITARITVKISLRNAGYPFTFRGTFVSSDKTLNQIYSACQLTQQLCSFDAYVDTPWREQAQWWGDARVQARNTFYMDGDARLLARGIRSIAGQPGPQGLTYGHAPTSADNCILPDFALTWILTTWDYYYQTGDISLFLEQWPRIQEVFAYFRSPEAVGKLGLLQYDPRFWLFEDWADLPKEKYPCFLNLWYLVTLRHVVEMLDIAKLGKLSAPYKKLAAEQEKRVIQYFFNKKEGTYHPALDVKGKPQGAPSVHDQTMALMLGLVPASHDSMIRKVLLPYLKGEAIPGALASAFWSFYVLEEMGLRGFQSEVVDFIRRGWGPMLVTGTTWENFDSIKDPGSSNCHAWTAHPSVHFTNLIVGIRQAAPAWKEIVFQPTFLSGIDRAEATIPSAAGDIYAKWTCSKNGVKGELKLPAQVKARVKLPDRKEAKVTGIYRFDIALPKS